MKSRFLIILAFCWAIIPSTLSWASCPSNLADEITTPIFGYEISYTDDNTDPDFFSNTNANRVSDALDDHHQAFLNLGFLAPFFNTDPQEICAYDSSNIGGANFCQISLDTPFLQPETEACIRLVAGHELLHHAQYAYINNGSTSCGGCGGTWGKWTCEGTARLMQDKIYADLDQNAGCITYLDEINDYLASPNTTLTSASYKAALWWNYLTEQLGTIISEPERGADVIEQFWDNTDPNNPDSMQVLRDTIQDFAPASSLEEIFHDFSITNYTKEFDVSAVPDANKYFYIDETPGGGGTVYNAVTRSTVSFSNSLSSSSVNAWAARYFEVTDISSQCEIIGFRGEADDNNLDLGWTVIGIKAPDRVVELHKGRGSSFYKAFFNDPSDPFVKIAAVVTGLNEGGNFDYVFGAGFPKVKILRPTFSRQAYVGEHSEPDRFQVRMLVAGPDVLTPNGSGSISVKGLSADNFTVQVVKGSIGFSEEAPVLTGAYVGGEYWLSCQAPVADDSETFYDLRVSLPGDCDAEDFERSALIYAKLIRNQMLVIDRSGSMASPSATPKLDAAQAAANIFVDAAANDDLLGVVSFTGDGPPDGKECNDDSEIRHDLLVVDDSNRTAAKNKIDGIAAGGWTGLGDGLIRAQDRLDILGNPVGIDHIVLLSDGMENEARCWDSTVPTCSNGPVPCNSDVKPIFTGGAGSDTIIDTIAFGPQTDQNLMQDIAATGTGDYYYVDVTDTSSAAASIAASASAAVINPAGLTRGNRMSEVYLAINDKILSKDRIFFDSENSVNGTVQHEIDITEGKIRQAIFAFNWEEPKAVSEVRLFDPLGNQIGAGDAEIFRDDTHTVFQFKDAVAGGNWVAEIEGKMVTQYMVAVSGKFVAGVQAELYFSQVPGERQCIIPSQYLAGLPVTILVSLADIRGGIHAAEVQALVDTPEGKMVNLPLFDDGQHDDGDAADGVYGNIFTGTAFFSQQGVPENEAEKDPGTRGSYNVFIIARGVSHQDEKFTRYLNKAFQVYECFLEIPTDRDRDGMPDRYEERYPCLNPEKPDADVDHDGDRLKSGEEYKLGTNPCDPDTDDGGEIDGSEVKRGANPMNPRDDKLPRPFDVEVITTLGDEDPTPLLFPETITFRYPAHPAYEALRILRGTSPRNLVEVGVIKPKEAEIAGIYFDKGLKNGQQYFYQLIAEGEDSQSLPSPIFSGIAKEDPVPPKGWVKINMGTLTTITPRVILYFDTDPDNTFVRVSNEPTFGKNGLPTRATDWMENPGNMQWDLAVKQGTAAVYVQFRDESGNESVTYHDSIIVDPDDDLDGDTIGNDEDNCLEIPNKDQSDKDKDGFGDVCDNCPFTPNPDQRDSDFNGIGNVCDCSTGDRDGDGDSDGEDAADLAHKYSGDPEDIQDFAKGFGKTGCYSPREL